MKRPDHEPELHLRIGTFEVRIPAAMMHHVLLLVALVSPVLAIYLFLHRP